ncbi:PEP-CTERM sorting domain-containing protein [Aestuariispira ectoiniformans]|uniref:PEP-CTERM sorting domain-containing protein n=1 Tax=Aestuariispira ectoiniformans TaxID=2775080 RepID=UPI00223AC0DD|nr:PEP-CTERM sorting domain-containing protein [Aestuariispira ectoiniformans]
MICMRRALPAVALVLAGAIVLHGPSRAAAIQSEHFAPTRHSPESSGALSHVETAAYATQAVPAPGAVGLLGLGLIGIGLGRRRKA